MIAHMDRLGTRALRAAGVGVYNLLIFILIPTLVGGALTSVYPTSPLLVSSFIYEFGIIITVLQVLGTLTDGSPLSIPFTSGGYIVAAFFVWIASNGGTLPLIYDGVSLTFAFQPVLFLLMVPLLFSALKEPIVFLLENTEVAHPSPDTA